MKEIVPDVYRIEGLSTANVYLLVTGTDLTLVDGGMARDVKQIVAQIEEVYDPSSLASILVTHAHGDHTGGIPELVQRFDADVIAHRAEAPYIERIDTMPARGVLQTFAHWVSDNLMAGERDGIDVTIRVEEGETLDILGGLQVIHTPGHTPGSMVLYQPERKLLFCGDLIFNGHPFTGRGGLQFAPKLFSVDPKEVKRSVDKLAGLEISALCGGHGAPILRDPSVTLGSLLREVRA